MFEQRLDNVTTCGHIKCVKVNKSYRQLDDAPEPQVLREVAALAGVGDVIPVRAAKAHLSALLDLVAGGREIVVTSDGQPKVKLVSYSMKPKRKVWKGASKHLKTMPPWQGGPTGEELIRADRDGRGW